MLVCLIWVLREVFFGNEWRLIIEEKAWRPCAEGGVGFWVSKWTHS